MKNIMYSTMIALFLTLTFIPNTFAQDELTMDLPEGPKARLGKGQITGEIVYSPDGTRLAVAGAAGVWLYDAQTLKEVALLTGHSLNVTSVSFSPDGQTLASGSADYSVRLWDVATGVQKHILRGGSNSVSFSPDGETLASVGYSAIYLWDVATGTEKHILEGHTDQVNSVSFSLDGKTLASAGGENYSTDDTSVRLWDVETGTQKDILEEHTRGVLSVSFSPDGETLASGSGDETIRLWDVETGTQKKKFLGHTDGVSSVAFSPDGETLASVSTDETIWLWNVETGAVQHILEEHTRGVLSVSFSPDGETLASGSEDNTIRLWDVETGTQKDILEEHNFYISSIAFSPDGQTLASGSWDSTIHLWDVATSTQKNILKGHGDLPPPPSYRQVISLSFSPDRQTLASGSSEGIRLWDIASSTQKNILKGHTGWVDSVVFSPDGKTIASGDDSVYYSPFATQFSRSGDNTIRLWDVDTGIQKHVIEEHTKGVNSVAFSPDGKTIASGSSDNTIRLWDVATGTQKKKFLGHTDGVSSVAFSPDGETLASGGFDGTFRLWDIDTGAQKHVLEFPGYVYRIAYSPVAFSPDGKVIATAMGGNFSSGTTLRLWDVETGTEQRILTGHTDTVTSVAFSPDGETLASGSFDGTVLLWDLAPTPTSDATVSLSPSTVPSPDIGEQLTFSLNITDGENVSGYQATVKFDSTALRYVSGENGDFLPTGAFFIPPIAESNSVQLAASSLAGEAAGDGTLATITFEVVTVKESTMRLSDVLLTNSAGDSFVPQRENAEITIPPKLPEDVNDDGVVNIIDLTLVASNFGKTGENIADINGDGVVNIVDLTLVASAFGNTAMDAAPALWSVNSENMPTRATVEKWLQEARKLNFTEPTLQRGIHVLENLLKLLTPKETALLANYPNPFNPETWVPYQLASPADVSISIYTADGKLIRQLDLGHQPVGMYHHQSRAAHWDGRNAQGEPVASGVYFYTLSAGEFSATRKMLIRK